MKITAIIQARMGSTRLPGKVLMDLGGETVLCRIVQRLRRASRIQEVAVATTESLADQKIVAACHGLNASHFRGSEHDVLDRYFHAAQHFQSDAIVRITSDCPLIDPELVDQLIQAFIEQRADFACNVLPRTYPRGLDAEIFTADALAKAWHEANQPHQREHVTPVFYERPHMFRTTSIRDEHDYSRYRWTVDTEDDLRLVRAIYSHFENGYEFSWRKVVTLMETLPELATMNAHVVQKPIKEHARVS